MTYDANPKAQGEADRAAQPSILVHAQFSARAPPTARVKRACGDWQHPDRRLGTTPPLYANARVSPMGQFHIEASALSRTRASPASLMFGTTSDRRRARRRQTAPSPRGSDSRDRGRHVNRGSPPCLRTIFPCLLEIDGRANTEALLQSPTCSCAPAISATTAIRLAQPRSQHDCNRRQAAARLRRRASLPSARTVDDADNCLDRGDVAERTSAMATRPVCAACKSTRLHRYRVSPDRAERQPRDGRRPLR